MRESRLSVRSAQLLILLAGLFWLAFGVVTAVGLHPSYRAGGWVRWALAGISLVAAAWLAGLFIGLRRRNRIAYGLSIVTLAAVALAGLLDELGLADFAFLVIVVLPLALLVKDRKWYLSKPSEQGV